MSAREIVLIALSMLSGIAITLLYFVMGFFESGLAQAIAKSLK